MSDAKLPRLACLCPTFKRPRCLANAIACFNAQDYPVERRKLYVLDDAGQYDSHSENGVILVSGSRRYASLPLKFHTLTLLSDFGPDRFGEAFVIWEDDDVYLPHHLRSVGELFARGAGYVTQRRVWSTYRMPPGDAVLEPAAGRFHASWAFSRELYDHVGGYPPTAALDFDQQLGALLRRGCEQIGKPHVELDTGNPGYVYRWGNATYHGSAFGPTDDWYERVGRLDLPAEFIGRPHACFDAETRLLYARLGGVTVH